MKYSVHDITIIGILSSLCGVCEIGLGTMLHMMKVPFSGVVMLFINLIIYFIAR